jgi:hypothetical protein
LGHLELDRGFEALSRPKRKFFISAATKVGLSRCLAGKGSPQEALTPPGSTSPFRDPGEGRLMVVSRDNPFASRTSRAVLAITAAAGICAAIAATPSASVGKENSVATTAKNLTRAGVTSGEPAKGMRPLGSGPTIRVGRAFDVEDEDCTLAVTKVPERSGQVHVTRSLTCVN